MKKQSSFKMKGFSGFGIDMTLNDNLNKAVRGKKVQLGPLKPGPLGEMTKKGKEINYKNFSNKMSYKADQARKMKDSLNKKPTNFGRRIFKNFKNVAKGFGKIAGKRAFGIGSMMMGTMGTADANPKMKGKMTFQQERDLITRVRRKKR
jgi:hypothetical protein|tara:strand:- start:200 stop:646 length:447 start_codon:yes stop_codon:yes gene_type:complete